MFTNEKQLKKIWLLMEKWVKEARSCFEGLSLTPVPLRENFKACVIQDNSR